MYSDTTTDDMIGQNLLEEHREAFLKEQYPLETTRRSRKFYLEILFRYLKGINSKEPEEYLSWLLKQRNFQGLYFEARTLQIIHGISLRFMEWLGGNGIRFSQGIIENREVTVSEVEEMCRSRREHFREERRNEPDGMIFKIYEEQILKYRISLAPA